MLSKIRIVFVRRYVAYFLVFAFITATLGGCNTASTTEIWGRAEAKEVDINSKIPGRVLILSVKEGERVEKGQVLARIDNRDITAQANQALAVIKAMEAQLAQAATTTFLQDQMTQATVDVAQSQLNKAAADLTMAEADYRRFSKLVKSGSISRQMFETYQARYEVAQASYAQAQSGLAKAQAGVLQVSISRDNEKSSLGRLQQSQAALQQVEVALDETEIKAPFAGIITAKYVEEGAMVSSGMPLVAIQDPLDNWVNIKVKETELSKYQLNQNVQLQGRDNKLQVKGIITDISKKPEFATYRATNERNDNDIITFNVKIQINSEKIRPGMRFQLVDGEK